MRLRASTCLMVAGATFGGFLPGSYMAWLIAASSGLDGFKGEALCMSANLLFGVAGALCGLLAGLVVDQESITARDLLVSISAGVIISIGGYSVLYYAITHADPPL